MKTRSKILLDEWLGRFVVNLLNLSARLLGKILRIDHSLDKIPERIVVCKFLGMGSIIQSTPLLQTLRQSFPRSKIFFVTAKSNEKLLKKVTSINEVWCVDDRNLFSVLSSSWQILQKLWKKKNDLYIDLETYSYYSTAMATLSLSRNRLGFYRAERNIRMGVYTHMMFFNTRAPIAESYLQMARLVGCREIETNLFPFKVKPEEKNKCKEIIHSIHPDASLNYVVINPNASDLRIERRWPLMNFADLIEKLSQDFPELGFYLIGNASERAWTEQLMQVLNERGIKKVYNTSGKFSLGELFAFIEDAKLTITNDTGPMHISFALKKTTVCLFGPASPSQYGHNPYAYGLYKNIYCSPCVHEFLSPPCRGDNQCMKLIAVEEVHSLCKMLLHGDRVSPPEFPFFPGQFARSNGVSILGLVERA